MLKLILNNNNNINNYNLKYIINSTSHCISNSSNNNNNCFYLKSYNNSLLNNEIKNYYSTKSLSSLLKNTKRKSSSDRKIKVNHISKNDMNEVLDFQYKYSGLIKRNNIGRSAQATLLKEEFNMGNEEIDDILGGKSNNNNEDEDEDGYIEGSNNSKGKIYYSEKITYSTDTSKDNEFIKRSLGNSSFTDKLEGDLEWKVYNDKEEDENYDDTPKIKELKKKELKKKGLEERDGNYYADDYLITTDYESYFLSPDQPNNRKEKNLFRRLDELKEAKQQSKSKRGFKINENKNDQFVGQTIVQSRMSSRILEVLNESPLFSPISFLNSITNDQEFNFENESDYDNNLKMLEAQKLLGSQVGSIGSAGGNFSLNSDDLQIDQEDPILSKADIILTHAEMSSDLRWVKLYWKRRSHSNVNGGEMKKKTIDDFSKQDALYNIQNVDDSNVKSILDSLGTNSAKHLVYDSYKPIINQSENNIISSNKFGSKVLTKHQYQNDLLDNNSNNYNNNSFGFKNNTFSLPNKKVELEISIKESNQNILDKERELEKEKQEKREKLLLKILSDSSINDDNTDDNNNTSINNNNNSNNNMSINNNSNNIDIIDDPLLQSLTNNNSKNNNNSDSNNNNISNNDEDKDNDYLDGDKNKKNKKKKEDVENRRKKKIRTLFHEITDKDIAHRLLKLKSRIRWIIGKRVQAKYVPDIMFIKDEDEIKDETTIDILDNLVPIEAKQLFVERVKSIEKTREKLKSKYSSLFYNAENNNNEDDEDNGLLDDLDNGEYNKEEEIDLYQVLQNFPSLRREKVVQKFLRYEKERLENELPDKQKQQQQQEKDKELELQKEIEQFAQIDNNNIDNTDNNTDIKQIFKQFNKDL